MVLCGRDKVGELLSQVCSGVGQEEMTAALQGLLAAAAHVRAAAITAMLDVPAFAEGAHHCIGATSLPKATLHRHGDQTQCWACKAITGEKP